LFDRHPGTDINAAAIGKLLWFGKFSGEEWGYLDELMREWQVLACVVDAEGFLWIGTQDGPARYDGRAWTSVPLPGTQESQWVRAIEAHLAPHVHDLRGCA